jgi:hypothetical protein
MRKCEYYKLIYYLMLLYQLQKLYSMILYNESGKKQKEMNMTYIRHHSNILLWVMQKNMRNLSQERYLPFWDSNQYLPNIFHRIINDKVWLNWGHIIWAGYEAGTWDMTTKF